jgi:hypothetical protein
VELAEGPVIGRGSANHPALVTLVRDAAETAGVDYQLQATGGQASLAHSTAGSSSSNDSTATSTSSLLVTAIPQLQGVFDDDDRRPYLGVAGYVAVVVLACCQLV